MRTTGPYHSLAYWCLAETDWKWDIDKICQVALELGFDALELVPPEFWPTVQAYGLRNALAANGMPDPPFSKGVNNPRYHDEVISHSKEVIDRCPEFRVPNIIAFTGYRWRDATNPESEIIPDAEAVTNSVKALRELATYSSGKGVTICLEHLNSRDDSHPMKGHPGYHGDDLDLCAEIVRQVGSEQVKLLFDIYHVQVMHGDVIRRLRKLAPLLGHVHTAGNPGRGELDDRQEIYYPAIVEALHDIGYERFIGHEFIPTRNPMEGLMQALEVCKATSLGEGSENVARRT